MIHESHSPSCQSSHPKDFKDHQYLSAPAKLAVSGGNNCSGSHKHYHARIMLQYARRLIQQESYCWLLEIVGMLQLFSDQTSRTKLHPESEQIGRKDLVMDLCRITGPGHREPGLSCLIADSMFEPFHLHGLVAFGIIPYDRHLVQRKDSDDSVLLCILECLKLPFARCLESDGLTNLNLYFARMEMEWLHCMHDYSCAVASIDTSP